MLNFLMHFVTVRLWAFLSNWKKRQKRGPNYVSQGKNEVKGMDCLTKMSRKKLFYNFGSKNVIRGGQAIRTSCKWDQRHLFKIIDFELDLFSITTNKSVKSGKLSNQLHFYQSLWGKINIFHPLDILGLKYFVGGLLRGANQQLPLQNSWFARPEDPTFNASLCIFHWEWPEFIVTWKLKRAFSKYKLNYSIRQVLLC